MIGIMRMPIGNLQSAFNAIWNLGFDVTWVEGPDQADAVTHLIVPGVGHFGAVMRNLESRDLPALIRRVASSGRPVLGICVGMQLLASEGTEGGVTPGLNLIGGRVAQIETNLRLPHVGWNTVSPAYAHPLFEGIKRNRDFYFVHSFVFRADEQSDVVATTGYGEDFTSVVGRDNVVGCQFHPEKSQTNGIKFLENFCNWNGKC